MYKLNFSIKALRALQYLSFCTLSLFQDFNEEECGQSENEEFKASEKVILQLQTFYEFFNQ